MHCRLAICRYHMADSASMSTNADAFLSWAADPSRTLEERFGILRPAGSQIPPVSEPNSQ